MADRQWSEIINDHPIESCLDNFHDLFNQMCEERDILPNPNTLDQLDNEDLRDLTYSLLSRLQTHSLANLLPSKANDDVLELDLKEMSKAVDTKHFKFNRIWSLLEAVLANKPDNEVFDQVDNVVTECTHRSQEIPLIRSINTFTKSFAYRQYVGNVLTEEFGFMYVGLRDFHETYFGSVPGLKTTSKALFELCMNGSNPFYDNGWRGWPKNSNTESMLSWFSNFCEKLVAFSKSREMFSTHQRRLLAKAQQLINGPNGCIEPRKINIGFVTMQKSKKDSRCHWSKILVLGEIKANPSGDRAEEAWVDLGEDARKVFFAQDTRRFVLGFNIRGSLMRVWEFDRLGGIASDQFDINVDGLRFVSTILGFLWMSEEQLGFDPTIITSEGQRYIKIERKALRSALLSTN